MQRSKVLSITLVSVLSLLMIASASADPRGRDRHRPGPPMIGDHGMRGGSDYMNVEGDIFVDDGITISLTISPTDEMRDRMHEDHDISVEDMTHSMNVTLYKLVEFEDEGSMGYDANDTVISSYALSSSNLGELQQTENGDMIVYEVSSDDGIFYLRVDVNVTDNLPHDWKWSLVINYPYVSNSSELAMLHTVENSFNDLIDPEHHYRPREPPATFPDNHHQYHNNSMIAEHERIPIVFSWDTVAVVDDTTVDVIATSFADEFSLALPQGEVIEYDPKLSIDTSDVNSLEQYIANIFGDPFVGFIGTTLGDILGGPSILGILITSGIIGMLVFLSKKK